MLTNPKDGKDHKAAREEYIKALERAMDYSTFTMGQITTAPTIEKKEEMMNLVFAHHGDNHLWWQAQMLADTIYEAVKKVKRIKYFKNEGQKLALDTATALLVSELILQLRLMHDDREAVNNMEVPTQTK